MRIVVIGGGKVGGNLARELDEAGHAVTLIEKQRELAARLGEDLQVLVLNGDGTDPAILEEADIRRAHWLVAVSGADEENLVACELAATLGTARVLARLNDPRNRRTFEALGIPVVAVTDLIARVISREVDPADIEHIATFGRGQLSLIEIDVPRDAESRLVAELRLPVETVLVAIVRDGTVEIPGARSEIRGGDQVLAVTTSDQESEVRAAVCDEPESS